MAGFVTEILMPFTDADIGNVPESLVNNDSLYEYGWCLFLPRHIPRLSTVLGNWRQLVEMGKWSVGPNGVDGGIEVFGDADTKEHSLKYRLTECFDGKKSFESESLEACMIQLIRPKLNAIRQLH